MKHIQHQNAQLLKMIEKIGREGGRVDTRWDQIFVTGWYASLQYTRVRSKQLLSNIALGMYVSVVCVRL